VAWLFDTALRERMQRNLATRDPVTLDAPQARQAAVGIVVLADAQQRASFVLTRRLERMRRHAGQWALPGGRLEPHETPVQAALREIFEEVNLEIPASNVLGRVDDFLSRSGHLISPFVVWADGAHDLRPNPDEVHAVYTVTLDELDRADNPRFEPLLHFGVIGTSVFAPTAAMLYQFRELALHGRHVDVLDVEQPFFAWR
jgi:ADP-ribose pyrophosphatase YjhB (NUDIX family)